MNFQFSQMQPGEMPRIEEWGDAIAIWDGDVANPIGIIVSPDAAVECGLALLAEASRQRGEAFVVPVTSAIRVEAATSPEREEDTAARLVLDLAGTPVAFSLSAKQIAEFAASLEKFVAAVK